MRLAVVNKFQNSVSGRVIFWSLHKASFLHLIPLITRLHFKGGLKCQTPLPLPHLPLTVRPTLSLFWFSLCFHIFRSSHSEVLLVVSKL